MKLHNTNTQQYQTVTAYDESGVEINMVRFSRSLIVMPETTPMDWPVDSFDSLTTEHFARIDAAEPLPGGRSGLAELSVKRSRQRRHRGKAVQRHVHDRYTLRRTASGTRTRCGFVSEAHGSSDT